MALLLGSGWLSKKEAQENATIRGEDFGII